MKPPTDGALNQVVLTTDIEALQRAARNKTGVPAQELRHILSGFDDPVLEVAFLRRMGLIKRNPRKKYVFTETGRALPPKKLKKGRTLS